MDDKEKRIANVLELSRTFGKVIGEFILANEGREPQDVMHEALAGLMTASGAICALISLAAGDPDLADAMGQKFVESTNVSKTASPSYTLGDEFVQALSKAAEREEGRMAKNEGNISEEWN